MEYRDFTGPKASLIYSPWQDQWPGDHAIAANDGAVTAKERYRHTDAGNNGPNGA